MIVSVVGLQLKWKRVLFGDCFDTMGFFRILHYRMTDCVRRELQLWLPWRELAGGPNKRSRKSDPMGVDFPYWRKSSCCNRSGECQHIP